MTQQSYSTAGYHLREARMAAPEDVCICSSVIHNCQEVETTQTPIDWWMANQQVIYPYRAAALNKQEQITGPRYTTDEPQICK